MANRITRLGKSPTFWLLLLGLVPILTGSISVILTANAVVNGADPGEAVHYAAHPIPILTHIICGSIMMLIGPFQINQRRRMRNPRRHRIMGRVFALAGFAGGFSAIYMGVTFPQIGGYPVQLTTLAFGIAMVVTLTLGIYHAISRNIQSHRLWITIAYALALGPATQRVFLMPYFMVVGYDVGSDVVFAALMAAGWIANLSVLFYTRRRKAGPRRISLPVMAGE